LAADRDKSITPATEIFSQTTRRVFKVDKLKKKKKERKASTPQRIKNRERREGSRGVEVYWERKDAGGFLEGCSDLQGERKDFYEKGNGWRDI